MGVKHHDLLMKTSNPPFLLKGREARRTRGATERLEIISEQGLLQWLWYQFCGWLTWVKIHFGLICVYRILVCKTVMI
ncbi:MAG TPA: hypothetical protein DCE56_33985 [Cyanobacteria bacterium UBA8553]|nr:hypothetical protein [Cyanobacteria bacterium UBA8553]